MPLKRDLSSKISTMPAKNHSKKTYKFGLIAEKIAIIFLCFKGYRILAWRYKTNFGEIDIIAKKSHVIAMIEVKARRSKISIEETLHLQQIWRMKKTAEYFLFENSQFHKCLLRLDFIEVNRFLIPKHYKNFIC